MEIVYILKKMFFPPYRFENNELEKEFLRNYGQKFLYHRRAVIIIGLCTWSLYLGWDIFHGYMNLEFAKVSSEIYTLRVIGILILIPIVWLMYTRLGVNEHKATIILSSGICTCYLLLLLMINIVPFPYNYLYYYIGLLFVLFFMFGLMRLRAKPVIVLALLCLVTSALSFYFDSTVKLAPLEKTQKIVNGYYWSAAMSYLITFMLIGCVISIELERTARKTFIREKELQNLNRDTENRTAALLLLKDELNMRLEEKNNYKSKFFAYMAHDLGNSMHSINLFFETSLYAANQENFELARQGFEDLGKSLRKMSATLNTVLNISEFELGVRKVNYTNFNIQDLVEDVVSNLAPLAVKQGVRRQLSCPG